MYIFFLVCHIFCISIGNRIEDVFEYTDVNLLIASQLWLGGNESKGFVDRTSKRPMAEILKDFEVIEKELGLQRLLSESLSTMLAAKSGVLNSKDYMISVIAIQKQLGDESKRKKFEDFIDKNFHPVGYDIEKVEPKDHKARIALLNKLKSEDLKKIAITLNEYWGQLVKRNKKLSEGEESTLIQLPNNFVVPGGRFREFYYWDSYWVMEGLLVSEMDETVNSMLKNFIYLINTYGYIPNGTRKYYIGRSQPPYFTLMLERALEVRESKFKELVLTQGLEMAEKEYNFFMENRSVEIIDDKNMKYTLNRFHVDTDYPRPESLKEDIETFERQGDKRTKEEVFTHLKSAAESGWDFSSRWFRDGKDIVTIATADSVPVDLNALLYKIECTLGKFHHMKENTEKYLEYRKKANARKDAINAILWNSTTKVWNDYDILTKKHISDRFYVSNIAPLVYGIDAPEGNKYDILYMYHKPLFGYIGGIPASGEGIESNQQWDFPNVWAPHQHMVKQLLLEMNEHELALHVAQAFYRSVVHNFHKKGAFFEKFNCVDYTKYGEGGEYDVVVGFGWTNGTLLDFIQEFEDKISEGMDIPEEYHTRSYQRIVEHLKLKISSKVPERDPVEYPEETLLYPNTTPIAPPATLRKV